MQMILRNCFTNSFAIEYDVSFNDDNVLCLHGNVGVSIKQKVCPKLAMYSLYLPLFSKSTRERSQRMADRALISAWRNVPISFINKCVVFSSFQQMTKLLMYINFHV